MIKESSNLFYCLLLTISLTAQSDTHYLAEADVYFKKSFGFASQRDTLTAKIYADSLRLVYRAAEDEYGEAMYEFCLGVIERAKGNTQEFSNYIESFIIKAKEVNDTSMLASAYYQFAIATDGLGDYDQALSHHHESMKYYEMAGDTTSPKHSLNMIGSIYKKMKQYDMAEEYFLRALKINKTENSISGQADNLVNLGNLYGELGNYKEALSAYQQATYYDSITNYKWGLAYDYENIGNLYARQKEYNRALPSFQKALDIRIALGGKFELAQSYLKMGELYHAIGQNRRALGYLNTALDYAQKSDVLESQKDAYRALSKTESSLGNFKRALEYQNEYVTLNDSLLNKDTNEKIASLSVQYETEKKEQEIALLNTNNELAASKLSASRRQSYGLLGGLLLFTGLLFFIYRLYKKTQSQNAIIFKALSEKETLLKEIHHRVKNNLQFISSLLGLQTEHVEDKAALGALQEGQDRVQSMALIHQNLYQEDNLTGVNMKDYFVKLIRGLFDSYNIRKDQVELQLDIQDLNLDVDTVIPIGLVVNELVSNSLKYAFPDNRKGTIKVALHEENKELQVRVADDGIGMSNTIKNTLGESFGYRLVNVFKDQMKAKLEIDGTNGAEVTMMIKKYEKV